MASHLVFQEEKLSFPLERTESRTVDAASSLRGGQRNKQLPLSQLRLPQKQAPPIAFRRACTRPRSTAARTETSAVPCRKDAREGKRLAAFPRLLPSRLQTDLWRLLAPCLR